MAGSSSSAGDLPPGLEQPPPPVPSESSNQLNDLIDSGVRENRISVAKDIGEKVEGMILQAKQASETKVSSEIRKIKLRMEQLKEKMQLVSERANKLTVEANGSTLGLPKAELLRSIAKLEEVWQNEVSTLKQELWQTIQAHNHNADLLKHHRDAIDQVHSKLPQVAANPELVNIHRQLVQVDAIMQREQEKQAQLDQLVQRFNAVQQAVSAAAALGWDGAGLYGGAGAPGLGGPGDATMATAAAASKKTKKQGAKSGKDAPTKGEPMKVVGASQAAAAATLRAEAPEFVPIQANWPEDGA
mmetsp:Transcript_67172/g.160880  ORF Transcript_67172/g.160880 Transcript_67172/m.160880 type:complete len:301 (-) Transcript_67172:163-1065(-)|eukprot:CAMPEP_0178448652 /NCGR_PEP_ID=MMETSP0689_2-20121128/42108_1 /TAXON_ID=160604 /ORGANISM="Amphidinium massartii, Strain CS-259" /LENGTH=300 /DNA_ID=CAMNT_0020073871 /DNA_START=335 /DNA_END=1237 /DNA_ORIENTATION=-